jgi:cobalamin-dependent methionine synthase I
MVEIVLREAGIHATSLGTSLPLATLIKAVQETQPKLFWLSVSHIREGLDFVSEFAALSQACMAAGTALVVGGRALTEDLRQRMTYSAYGDTMQHLEGFAKSLTGSLVRSQDHRQPAPTRGTRSVKNQATKITNRKEKKRD